MGSGNETSTCMRGHTVLCRSPQLTIDQSDSRQIVCTLAAGRCSCPTGYYVLVDITPLPHYSEYLFNSIPAEVVAETMCVSVSSIYWYSQRYQATGDVRPLQRKQTGLITLTFKVIGYRLTSFFGRMRQG